MGFGLPAAIGAALAAPDRPVVCISGDGSLLMNIQDLAGGIDFDTIAAGFGWPVLELTGRARDAGPLEAALAAPGPRFIHARIDGDARVYPMVPPGAANADMLTEALDER